jgi:hypothetical protein
MKRDDDGSTLPLILGFFLIALLMVAGSIAAGDAFVQQRDLQDMCDGAATAAAASGVDLGRGEHSLQFGDVAGAVSSYVARDPARRALHISAQLSRDRRTLSLRCEETERIAFGTMFGKGDGVHHIATSSARAPLS